jgi:hypothetical protein
VACLALLALQRRDILLLGVRTLDSSSGFCCILFSLGFPLPATHPNIQPNGFVRSARFFPALPVMLARRMVLLTLPSDGSCPAWSYFHTGTLPRLISFASHSYENTGGYVHSSHFGTHRLRSPLLSSFFLFMHLRGTHFASPLF